MGQLVVLFLMLIVGITDAQDAPDVRIPPSIEEKGPEQIIYRSDDLVTIPCRASGIPTPTYKWTINGQPLDFTWHVKMSSEDGSLTFNPITSLDEGYYQCIAKNQYGQDLSSLTLLRRAVLGRYPPGVTQIYTGKEGQPLILPCAEIKSVPAPTFHWALREDIYGYQTPVALDERIQIDVNGNLYFAYLTTADTNNDHIYTCNVYNSVLDVTTGGSYSQIQVKSGSLRNRGPALMYSTPSKVIALRGQDEVRFKCFFSGKPAPGLSWVRVGGALPAGRFALEASNTELVIQNVQETDGGMYQCTASNIAGTSSTKFTLDVQSKPEFVHDLRPTSTNATEEDQAEFNCKVDAEPPATVTWYINGEPVDNLNPGPRRKISKNGTRFTISNLCRDCPDGQSDLMVVQCNASNVHGYKFASGYLNVISSAHNNADSDNEPPLILLATRTDIEAISISSGDQKSRVESLVNVIDVDYDYDEDEIFFTDIIQHTISVVSNINPRQNVSLPRELEVIVSNSTRAEAIAYDWVHKVLYWTDSRKDTIELLTMRGRHSLTIVDANLDSPRGIAVDPRYDQNWVYWTDWGRKPKIEKAGLDGSHHTLVVATDLGWPNDLTIDHAGNRLYWTDSKLDSISSCDLNGRNVQVVFSDARFTRHAFSIDVLGDFVYWGDWRTNGIYAVNKNNRSLNARTVRRTSRQPFGLRMYDQTRQPRGLDPCGVNNGDCSHICLVAPAIGSSKMKFGCFCPDTGC